jgi:hypothetical protein
MQDTDAFGLATAIVYSGAVSGNPFGHVGLGFSDAGVYSYGTSEPYGSNLTEYVNGQAASRDVTIAIINTTPAQEQAMREVYKNAHKTPYSLGAHNCANIAGDALLRAGVATDILGSPYGPLAMPTLPSEILAIAASQSGASIIHVPQGASSPSILYQFNPKGP